MADRAGSPSQESLKDEFYKAVVEREGDCVHVMQLLIKDSSLMQHWPERVLHLGVRRGCADLVEQVVKFCNGEALLGDNSKKDRQGIEISGKGEINSSSSNKGAPTTTLVPDDPDEIQTPPADGSSKHGDHSPDAALAGPADKDNFSTGATIDLNERLVGVEGDRQAVEISTEKFSEEINSSSNNNPDEIQTLAGASSNKNDVGSSHSQDAALGGRPADKDKFGRALINLNKRIAQNRKADQRHGRSGVNLADLLLWKTPDYSNLDALAVALLNGNIDVLSLLYQKRRCDPQIKSGHMEKLRTIAERVVASLKEDSVAHQSCQSIFNAMSSNRDFNFLFWDFDRGEERVSEYLFHFLCTNEFKGNSWSDAKLIRECLWLEVRNSSTKEDPLWKSLLKLHDAQGRTPLHVAVDEGTVYDLRVSVESDAERDVRDFAVGAPDGLGRTAWHRAVLVANSSTMVDLRLFADQNQFWASTMKDPLDSLKERGIDVNQPSGRLVNTISERNGFEGSRAVISGVIPLHSTIIHGRTEQVDNAVELRFSTRDLPFSCKIGDMWRELDALELATLTGDAYMVRLLLEHMSKKLKRNYGMLVGDRRNSGILLECPTIHVAGSSGNYEVLKAFLEHSNKLCDPFIEDWKNRMVLHHAMNVEDFKFQPHLLDYLNMKHLDSNDPRSCSDPQLTEKAILERQGCINLLLQSGCDIFKADGDGQVPYPRGNLSTSKSFLSWWYGKQSEEFKASQNAMSFATNAISVMATLVATAAYVGPLQPPLGYNSTEAGPNQVQAKYTWVRIFIVCDTLSFYLAIVSITFSLIPSLPMPQQPMKDELERTRGMIICAVATLFPSIVCILIAFAAGSIVVVSANGISSVGGNVTIITASLGGSICLIGFVLLFIRVLGIIFPRTTWVKKMYNVTSSILQWRF